MIVQGKQSGAVTDIVANLVDNVGGIRHTIVADSNLPARLREIANRLADDHQSMMRRYEVSYAGDPKQVLPVVKVTSAVTTCSCRCLCDGRSERGAVQGASCGA